MNKYQIINAINFAFVRASGIVSRFMDRLESLPPAPTYAEKMSRNRKISFALIKT